LRRYDEREEERVAHDGLTGRCARNMRRAPAVGYVVNANTCGRWLARSSHFEDASGLAAEAG
jgi:hypothetical protein